MDAQEIRTKTYLETFIGHLQANGYEVLLSNIPSAIIICVYENNLYKGNIRCQKHKDACTVNTLQPTLADSPFGLSREFFIKNLAVHWNVGPYYTDECGFCHAVLPNSKSHCLTCYAQRCELLDLSCKGKYLTLYKNHASLVPDIMWCILCQMSALTAQHQVTMMGGDRAT